MENFVELGYIGLFIASFLAATVLPLSSEVVFTTLIFMGFDSVTCLLVGSAGNTLGGMTCYWLGYLGNSEKVEKYLGIKKEKVDALQNRLQSKGFYIAFFTFLPLIGDLIAVCLGFLRTNIYGTSVFMFLGKLARYIVLYYLTMGVINLL